MLMHAERCFTYYFSKAILPRSHTSEIPYCLIFLKLMCWFFSRNHYCGQHSLCGWGWRLKKSCWVSTAFVAEVGGCKKILLGPVVYSSYWLGSVLGTHLLFGKRCWKLHENERNWTKGHTSLGSLLTVKSFHTYACWSLSIPLSWWLTGSSSETCSSTTGVTSNFSPCVHDEAPIVTTRYTVDRITIGNI